MQESDLKLWLVWWQGRPWGVDNQWCNEDWVKFSVKILMCLPAGLWFQELQRLYPGCAGEEGPGLNQEQLAAGDGHNKSTTTCGPFY